MLVSEFSFFFIHVLVRSGVVPGRPFVVEGKSRTATSQNFSLGEENYASSWSNIQKPTILAKTALSGEIGSRWLTLGEAEHASVASFAKHTLQLMSIGAPSELLAASQEASLDEIRHAKICYGFASTFLGSEFGPGPLDVEGSLGKMELKKIAQSIIQEGCIEETISAVEAHLGAYTAQEPSIKEALGQIATDETRHAQFAWDTIQWMVKRFPEVQDYVTETFKTEVEDRLLALEKSVLLKEASNCDALDVNDIFRSYGLVVMCDKNKVREAAIQDIIMPVYLKGLNDVKMVSKLVTKFKFGFLQ